MWAEWGPGPQPHKEQLSFTHPDQRSHTVLSANLNQLPAFTEGQVFQFP